MTITLGCHQWTFAQCTVAEAADFGIGIIRSWHGLVAEEDAVHDRGVLPHQQAAADRGLIRGEQAVADGDRRGIAREPAAVPRTLLLAGRGGPRHRLVGRRAQSACRG